MTDIFLDGGDAFTTYTAPAVAPAVFAPDIATYATRTPYITATEFTEAGTGVDVGQLVPQGTTGDQAAALTRAIARASAAADTFCRKVLAATADTDAGRWLVRDGVCSVALRFTPVTAVTGISTGSSPWSMSPLSDLSRVAIRPPKVVDFAVPAARAGRLHVAVTYVNGWTCTTLADPASAGDTALTLTSTLGLYPGLTLTVDDGAATEQVTLDAGWTPGATGPVTLTAPLASNHGAGAACSAMPQDIKQAVILLTAWLIKTRGSEAFVMQSISAPPAKRDVAESGGSADLENAKFLLSDYRRTW